MERKNLTTYPQMLEGLKGEGWTVINGGIEALIQQTDLVGKVLVVPDGETTLERNTRIKELAGARWTPPTSLPKTAEKEKVDPACLRAAEDYRLTFNVQRAAPILFTDQFSKGVADPEAIEAFLDEMEADDPEVVKALPLIMAALGKTEGAARFLNGMKMKKYPPTMIGLIKQKAMDALIREAGLIESIGTGIFRKHLRGPYVGFPKSILFARELMKKQEACLSIALSCRDEIRASQHKGAVDAADKMLKMSVEKHRIRDMEMMVGFGELTVKIPPMIMPVKAKNKIARHRVTDEGVIPFQLWRLHIDGKIFLDPRKQKGGSVVVDISGSMGLHPEQVYEFVLDCPGATIAQYSGRGDGGVLTVVAHKGKIAPRALIGSSLGGNVVDGPSLEWLSRMPRPRVWVSDTQATGVGDMSSQKLRQKCLDFCQKHQIKIVTRFDVKAVTQALHQSHRLLLAKIRKDKAYA